MKSWLSKQVTHNIQWFPLSRFCSQICTSELQFFSPLIQFSLNWMTFPWCQNWPSIYLTKSHLIIRQYYQALNALELFVVVEHKRYSRKININWRIWRKLKITLESMSLGIFKSYLNVWKIIILESEGCAERDKMVLRHEKIFLFISYKLKLMTFLVSLAFHFGFKISYNKNNLSSLQKNQMSWRWHRFFISLQDLEQLLRFHHQT